MANLEEKLRRADQQSFDKWFNRWLKKYNPEKHMMDAAMKGFTGLLIFDEYSDTYPDRRDPYEKRRMADVRFFERLKQEFPDVQLKREQVPHKPLIGSPYSSIRIRASWGVSHG
ncbi:hypothetical protein [Lacticaseibacillus absianus]|uniref:hypothetical protein n=1 Tax=Lacticaseibacillus absianus TaxID=2729623 RepID=UPI0015CAB908|nr:hypothetical protein [Lacticaseibacillus absianus]